MKFAPGGHSTFFAMLNAFVHIVMYFYYMIAAMGPKYQKYIWWKKYLTAFQMVSSAEGQHLRQLSINLISSKGPIRRYFHASVPAPLDRLSIPQRLYGVDRASRCNVLVPLLRLLQTELYRKAKKTERSEEIIDEWKSSLQ